MSEPTFRVHYQSFGALERDCSQQISMRGMLLECPVEMDQFTQVQVEISCPDKKSFTLGAEVVQVMPGQGVAVQFNGQGQELDALLAHCAAKRPAATQKTADEDPKFYPPGEKPSGVDNRNAPKKPEDMTVAEKRSSALHGRKEMRTLLIRDHNKTIHPFVLKNPGITLDEVQQIARMPSVNPEALRLIAANRDWTRSTTVCRNLIRNPKTPIRDALKLMSKMPIGELRALAKSSNVRTPIQQAARKKVNA